MPVLKRNIVLVGMMGAGKTAIGKSLASRLDVPFRDSDAALEEAANMTIPEIFARDGEAFFREKEAQIISRLLDETPGILSTGGGAFLRPETRALIAERGLAVWLKADLEVLWQRVRHKDTRPLLRTPDPRATLAELLEARTPSYSEAGVTVEALGAYSIDDTTDAVMTALSNVSGILETTDA
ncbi:MAG: shikimate kinase [Rhodobacteraceae bacterium]|nr:shikimate kinase [Paracoccaceae bacterium]